MQSLRQADRSNTPVVISCGLSHDGPEELKNLPDIAPKDFSVGMMQVECKPADLCRLDKVIPNRNVSSASNSYSHLYPYNSLKQDIGYTGNCICNQFVQSP